MKLIATIPCRNEGWIIGLSARVALQWCDEIVLLNHASTDQSVDIIADLQASEPFRVHVISVPETQWSEMQHRQMMLDLARTKGATHIAIVDADEVLTGNLLNSTQLRERIAWTSGMINLPGYNLRCSLNRYHLTGIWGNRWFSTAFCDYPRLYWSSQNRDGYDHHHREPMGLTLQAHKAIAQGDGGVMHLWGVSDRRLRAKHALYKVIERLRWPDKSVQSIDEMYSWWKTGIKSDEPHTWKFADVPAEWWTPYADLMKYLDIDAEPWQEAEVKRLIDKHGGSTFAGLDLFGVG